MNTNKHEFVFAPPAQKKISVFIRVHSWLIIFLLATALAGCAKKDAASAGAGGMAPDFTLKDLDGKDVSLSDFAGKKVVLVSFWATWCASCREEIPVLNRLQREFGDRGLVVLGVNVGESPEQVKGFLKKRRARYTILLDETGEVAQAKYHIYGLPYNIVVGGDGAVAYRGVAPPGNSEKFFGKLPKD